MGAEDDSKDTSSDKENSIPSILPSSSVSFEIRVDTQSTHQLTSPSSQDFSLLRVN